MPGYGTKLGLPLTIQTPTGPQTTFGDQFNQAKQLTISNSNLSTFSDVGFVAHPGYLALVTGVNFPGGVARTTTLGEATHSYLYKQRYVLQHADCADQPPRRRTTVVAQARPWR